MAKPPVAEPAPKRAVVRVVIPGDKFPAKRNPQLERALQIHFAMQKGLTRAEAVELADEKVGPRAGLVLAARPKAKPNSVAAAMKHRTRKASAPTNRRLRR